MVVQAKVAWRSPTEPSIPGSASQNVQWRFKAYAAPQNVKVAIPTELRFLRFQAPWAYGRKLFVLLRSTLANNWAHIRHELMDAVRKGPVRGHSERVAIWNMRNLEIRVTNMFVGKMGYGGVAVKGRKWRQAGFYTRIGVGFLTNVCKRPQPRFAVFQHNCPPYTFG